MWMLAEHQIVSLSHSARFVLYFEGDSTVCRIRLREKPLHSVVLADLPDQVDPKLLSDRLQGIAEVKRLYTLALYTYKVLRAQIRDLDLVVLLTQKEISCTLRNNGVSATHSLPVDALWNGLFALGIIPVATSSPTENARRLFSDLAHQLIVDFTLLRHLRWQQDRIESHSPGDLQEAFQANVKDLRVGVCVVADGWQISLSLEQVTVSQEISAERIRQAHDLRWANLLTEMIQQYGLGRYQIKEVSYGPASE